MRGNETNRLLCNDVRDGGFVGHSKGTIVNGEIAGLNTVAHSVICEGMGQAPVERSFTRP